MRRPLASIALLLLGCRSGYAAADAAPGATRRASAPRSRVDAAPPRELDAAPAAAAPRPLPARTTLHVHLPGARPNDHLNVTIDIGSGPVWTITGCVSSAPHACRETGRRSLAPAERVEYVQLWSAMYAIPRCEPEGIFPGDRRFEIDGAAGHFAGNLPADPAQLPSRTVGPCLAPARLAVWVARRFGALP